MRRATEQNSQHIQCCEVAHEPGVYILVFCRLASHGCFSDGGSRRQTAYVLEAPEGIRLPHHQAWRSACPLQMHCKGDALQTLLSGRSRTEEHVSLGADDGPQGSRGTCITRNGGTRVQLPSQTTCEVSIGYQLHVERSQEPVSHCAHQHASMHTVS